MYKKYKHHKVHHKNWVIFALVFISTSLVTSGLATFVVAQAKKNEEQGEVKVGVVNDTHVHFADLQFSYDPDKKDDELYKDKITFDADETDNSGRVQHDTVYGKEHRTVTLTGKVGPRTYINTCTYQFSIPQSVQDAIDAEYIQLAMPDGGDYDASKDQIQAPKDLVTGKADTEHDEASFSVTCGCRWAKFFNYENPCFYYDDTKEHGGASKSDKEVVDERNEFRRVRYYGKDSTAQILEDNTQLPELKFTITLTAKTSLS